MADLPDQPLYLPEAYKHLMPEEYAAELASFVRQFAPLINMHIVDFITTKQWELLDPEWQSALLLPNDEECVDSLLHLAAADAKHDTWPVSLKNFVKRARDLPLPRIPLPDYSLVPCQLDRHVQPGMTEKKIHEVSSMSTLVKHAATRKDIHSVMDLGAGQGYLSRTLAFQHNLQVLAVDGSEVQTCGAKRFDQHCIKKLLDRQTFQLHHVTDMVTPENISGILSKWRAKEGEDESPDDEQEWLLCGLHACGDLSSLMLRLFVESEEIGSLVNVGCCYHFLTEEQGFPMSEFIKNKLRYRSTSTANMLACQTPSRWLDRSAEALKAFEHHFFRALLQHIMVDKGLATVDNAPILGRMNKKKDFVSFPIYVQAALRRFGIPENTICPDEAEAYYKEAIEKQIDKQIAILWTVRVLLAPALESLILMDRWIYLKEELSKHPDTKTKGIWMWPLFDPITSPRNMVIVASK
ncbi:methyltransferase domain-containing protein [Dichotomocladium elegans]|nr:methyltransferase domain-containing protein [Dichotomocladium elegans]